MDVVTVVVIDSPSVNCQFQQQLKYIYVCAVPRPLVVDEWSEAIYLFIMVK